MNNPYKKIIIAIGALGVVALGAVLVLQNYQIRIDKKSSTPAATLTESEARIIAEASCIKGGEALSAGSYNPNSKTWWFDANLNATREGCNPACVVSEETKTAEINWRCTGLKMNNTNSSSTNNECTCPSGYRKDGDSCTPECYYSNPPCLAPSIPCQSNTIEKCGIENCHGLDIECGTPVQMCTMEYQLGDKCRQYAKCGVVSGKCQQIESPEFTACKSCVQKCENDFPNDPDKAFVCESQCGE
jgi:hypothetical protein